MKPGVTAAAAIPFVDLGRAHRPIESELTRAFRRVLEDGDFTLGRELAMFEREFADYVGAAFAVGVASGTAALSLGLRAAGVGPGDDVIVPAHTYVASAFAVLHAGARPVICDVDEETGLIDLDTAAAAVGHRTAAVMPVHLYGQACDMDAVAAFAQRQGLAVIEDACQAQGATWHGRRVGSFGVASAFSFYPSKNLGALGDGGAVCTNDSEIAEAVRRLRNLGQTRKDEHVEVGWNERLHTLQAAVLRVKLRHLDRWNEARRDVAARYRRRLPDDIAQLPVRDAAADVHHLLPIRLNDRDGAARELAEAGIQTGVHYPRPLHLQAPLAGLVNGQAQPRAERWASTELSLPMFPGLGPEEVDVVCGALARVGRVEVRR